MGVSETLHPFQVSYLFKVVALSGFASRVRTGAYSFGHTVGVQTVQVTLRAIGKTVDMEYGYNSIYQTDQKYLGPLEQQMECFRRQDPLPSPELAVPVELSWWLLDFGLLSSASEKNKAMGDLGMIAFYFFITGWQVYIRKMVYYPNKTILPARYILYEG